MTKSKKTKYGCYGTFFTDSEGNLKYKIAKNDTLWTISKHYFKDPLKYKDIYNLNKNVIKDPHWIYPGQVITIKKAEQKPKPKPEPKPQQKPEPKQKGESSSFPKIERIPEFDSVDIEYVDLKFNGPSMPVFTGEYVQEEPIVNLDVYEYIFGINNISLKSTQYYQKAIFVTNDIIKDKNIRYIEIESTEEHPVLDSKYDNPYCTSIEYYITYDNKNWIPILPKNKKRIENELIIGEFIHNGENKFDLRAKTMFTPDITKPIYVYENGKAINDIRYIVIGNSITIKNADSKNDYTISYEPNQNSFATKIVINKETIEASIKLKEEEFSGTDYNKRIVLQDTPYMPVSLKNSEHNPNIKNEIYGICMPVDVTLKNKDILDKNKLFNEYIYQDGNSSIKTKNKTNYFEEKTEELAQFNAYNNPYIEYYHTGRELYFSDTLNDNDNKYNYINNTSIGNADIIVRYYAPSISVKLKVIMRITNRYTDNIVTPKIKNIRLFGWCIN